jgi:A/G-specific adenine glycosylase
MSETMNLPAGFARCMVDWQRQQGRQHLPWQHTRDPYRVWLSEIMLQQTQVSTVLDYYPRFLERFPQVGALAAAAEDEVLGLWSGLGYYSRARHLHRCAREVVERFDGRFPGSAAQLVTLPGIGPSTAAAIAAFCFDERVSILDGNVKRVLTRVLGYGADLAVASHERDLWRLAEHLLPQQAGDMPAYTQSLMDLGATVCLPRKVQCEVCPVRHLCVAHVESRPLSYPVKSRKLKRSSVTMWLLWAQGPQGQVWLVKRPQRGIWAGLFSLPVFHDEAQLLAACPTAVPHQHLTPWKHVLTHRDLHLHPVRVQMQFGQEPACEGDWVAAQDWPQRGLPAPIRRLLEGRVG